MTTTLRFVLLFCVVFVLTGCGAHGPCGGPVTTLVMDPPSATLDHAAAAPANSVWLHAVDPTPIKKGCARAAIYGTKADWTVSDTENITLTQASQSTQALVTCVHPTPQPATVTATAVGTNVKATAQITCQ